MKEKIRVILVGAGSRGKMYAKRLKDQGVGDVVAVCEPIESRRRAVKEYHGLPDEACFESWEMLLSRPRIADLCVIATMDKEHTAPAIAAIEKGYNLLLEKPIAANVEDIKLIEAAAKKKGVFVLVCHVLRYTPFWKAIKSILNDGKIGKIMNIQHAECVGNIHQSHSFVRGNWSNSEKSTPMILQKCCHDMDILYWLIGERCEAVQSFGALSHFCIESAPQEAPDFCVQGCKYANECPYNAVKLYYDDKDNAWFRNAATHKASATDEDVMRAISESDYGRCVYKSNNNVVDHQIVNLQFGGGVLVSFTMSAFNKGGRYIRIMGTSGELTASVDSDTIKLYTFADKKTVELPIASLGDSIVDGHGGGDMGIIEAVRDLFMGKENISVSDISESLHSHLIAFAAEESRLSGRIIYL